MPKPDIDYARLAVGCGFAYLGPITAGASGNVSFPKPPRGGGLYCIVFRSGGAYIGETGLFGRQDDKVGRFGHYANPADDIWTELVVHKMLAVGGGGDVYVLPMEGDKRARLDLEASLIDAFAEEGACLWNDTPTRDEQDYLAWLLPIARQMLASARMRYAPRANLKPYSQGRLGKLPEVIAELEARAIELGLPVAVETAEFSEAAGFTLPPLPALVKQKPISEPKSDSQAPMKTQRRISCPTENAKVHRYLAERPDATKERLLRDMSGIKRSTVETLWRDHQMTLRALHGPDYKLGEPVTLTIRRIICRRFQLNLDVSARAVALELRSLDVEAKPGTISGTAANTISSLRALAAVSDKPSDTGK
jgi:hypothetical protein